MEKLIVDFGKIPEEVLLEYGVEVFENYEAVFDLLYYDDEQVSRRDLIELLKDRTMKEVVESEPYLYKCDGKYYRCTEADLVNELAEKYPQAKSDWSKNRVVVICYDENAEVSPYAAGSSLFLNDDVVYDVMVSMAENEVKELMDGYKGEGHFAVDEGGVSSLVAVNWYSVKPEEMEENSCDILKVSEYDFYPIEKQCLTEGAVYSYRGFRITENEKRNRFTVWSEENHDYSLANKHSLTSALSFVDEFCLVYDLGQKKSFDDKLKNAVAKSEEANKMVSKSFVKDTDVKDLD